MACRSASRTALVLVVLTATFGLPQVLPAVAASTVNATSVDGFSAVACGTPVAARGRKLVATCRNGYLPNNIIKKALDSSKLAGKTLAQVRAGLWRLNGNAATAKSFLGTKNNVPLVLKANGQRVMLYQPVTLNPNIIGGYSGNSVTPGVQGATIAGGGNHPDGEAPTASNRATDDFATVGGGADNQAGNGAGGTSDRRYATVGGGASNAAIGQGSTVSGGQNNDAGSALATVGGGESNEASSDFATVGGGERNEATGYTATVAGGGSNEASNAYATVGGGDSNTASGDTTTVGGGVSNTASGDLATVGGGGGNLASSARATIAGGVFNAASGTHAAVGGGESNTASAHHATVGGGESNTADAHHVTIGGGKSNTANAFNATIGGGESNSVSGTNGTVAGGISNAATASAMVPGGASNAANGFWSFAAGRRAKADDQGAYVWADSNDFDFHSNSFPCVQQVTNACFPTPTSGTNTYNVRATGGVRFVTGTDASGKPTNGCYIIGGNLTCTGTVSGTSDRRVKHHFRTVRASSVLRRVASLPVSTWSYKSDTPSVRHLGPMAQDFYRAFRLGGSRTTISYTDEAGVALAAIKGLHAKVRAQHRQIHSLKARVARLERLVKKALSTS